MQRIFSFKKSIKNIAICLISLGMLNLAVNWLLNQGYHFCWSQSESMPRGLYLITPYKKLARFDLVELSTDAEALKLAHERGWLPRGVSVIKYVAAIPGDEVSINAEGVYINHQKYGEVLAFDRKQLPLPQLKVHKVLGTSEYLLLGKCDPHSFDGRYFGVVFEGVIQGRAHLLWQI